MKSIVIYISELRPDLLDDIFSKHFLMFDKVQQNELKRLVIGSGANFSHASHFVIDLSSLNDDHAEIIDAVGALKSMYKSKRIVAIADKEPENSVLLSKLYDKGVYDIVTDLDNGDLEKCILTGKTKEEASIYSNTRPDLTAQTAIHKKEPETPPPKQEIVPAPVTVAVVKEKITANRSFRKHKPFVTIAICSTEQHMGATQQALLIAKFLNNIGFKACYLEANQRRNILYLAGTYAVNANEKKKLLQFEGVDMYFDFKLPEIIAIGYDFYIFDFGSFAEAETTSFLTKDIKIVVGGTKAWEIPAYRGVFDGIGGNLSASLDVQFILNFAPKKDMADIKELMGEYKKNTYFSDYAPYPFEYGANHHIYKAIFEDYVYVEKVESNAPEQRSKNKLFTRR